MITKKRLNRIINLLDNLRGSKNSMRKRISITPFKILFNRTFGDGSYHDFYTNVLYKYHTFYYTNELIIKSTEYLQDHFKIIDKG